MAFLHCNGLFWIYTPCFNKLVISNSQNNNIHRHFDVKLKVIYFALLGQITSYCNSKVYKQYIPHMEPHSQTAHGPLEWGLGMRPLSPSYTSSVYLASNAMCMK